MALTIWPIQSSPSRIEEPLCWEVLPVGPVGSTMLKAGRVPAASVRMLPTDTIFWRWLEPQHSKKVGQIPQMLVALAYSFQLSPAASRRSMIVGTYATGEAR